MIISKMISVVVQGPIHYQENLAKRVLESVSKYLHDAELILSTWKGIDTSGLDYDIALLNNTLYRWKQSSQSQSFLYAE